LKRCLTTTLFILILLSFAAGAADIGAIKNESPISRELNALYIKAYSREKLRSFSDALYAYNVILARVQTLVNSRSTSNDTLSYAMPYAIAAAYRKGIVTHRSIEGSVVKLYTQLKLYEDSEKWTNEVLTEISNLEFERGLKIPESQYSMLYFARAYNKMGWAYALFNGNYWKRYLIYTPADTVLMVDKAMDDLDKMYSAYKDSIVITPTLSQTQTDVALAFGEDQIPGFELLTYSLCYNSEDIQNIKSLMGRQLIKNVKGAFDLYNSRDVKGDLDSGRKIFTFEDLLDAKSREVATSMAMILKEMGTN